MNAEAHEKLVDAIGHVVTLESANTILTERIEQLAQQIRELGHEPAAEPPSQSDSASNAKLRAVGAGDPGAGGEERV
jgi:hypothetical protein